MLDSPFYVPFPEYEGVWDREMGSLLGLPSDQNVTVTLKWYPAAEATEGRLEMGVAPSIVESLQAEMRSRPDVQDVVNMGQERFSISGKPIHRTWGTYSGTSLEDRDGVSPPGEGVFQAALWTLRQKTIMVILRSRVFRYAGVRSTPGRDVLDRLMRDLVRTLE